MSPIIIKTIQFFLSLSLLIVLHELGHFIPAKLFKTRVEKFYLFFDVKFALFKKKIKGTEYGIGWLPLGGYVKIAGMIDESMDTEAMKEAPKPWEFRSKPAWQRLIIMLGGVTVNFVLAIIIYVGMAWGYGDQYIANQSLSDGVFVTEKTIGDKIGIQTGDKIIAIDGKPIVDFNKIFIGLVNGNKFTVERNGETIEKEIPVDFIATLLEDEDRMRFLSPRFPFVIGGIPEQSANINAGLAVKDEVVAIGDQPVKYIDEAKQLLKEYKGREVSLTINRADKTQVQIPVTVTDSATVGVMLGGLSYDVKLNSVDYLAAPVSFAYMYYDIVQISTS